MGKDKFLQKLQQNSRIVSIAFTFIMPSGLVPLRPSSIGISFGMPRFLDSLTIRLSSKYTLTSERCAMNVIEETKKRVKSKAGGIGPGSLSVI
jgi:aminoglycoside N3'-acetyltransferase